MRSPRPRAVVGVTSERATEDVIRRRVLTLQLECVIAERDNALADRDALRRVLAPLLDDPFRAWEKGWVICPLCLAQHVDEWNFPHAADCPVLQKDTLLGRTP